MKTTCRKSWPTNLFQVLNLTFDPCFQVKWGNHTKIPYFSLIICAMASDYNDRPSKVLAFKCFAGEKIWPYFEKQNGRHRQLFKNSIRDAHTPQPGELFFNTMRYRSSVTVQSSRYFQSSVSYIKVQIMLK